MQAQAGDTPRPHARCTRLEATRALMASQRASRPGRTSHPPAQIQRRTVARYRIERRTEGVAQLRFLERDDEPLKVGERQRQQKRRPPLVQQACLSEVGE